MNMHEPCKSDDKIGGVVYTHACILELDLYNNMLANDSYIITIVTIPLHDIVVTTAAGMMVSQVYPTQMGSA